MTRQLVLLITLLASCRLYAADPFAAEKSDMPRHCSDIEAVAKEAIAYHMTGAPTSDLPNNCAKKQTWKYFDPNIETRNYPPKILPQYNFFDPAKDSYKIKKVRKVGEKFEIDVDFTLGKKKISTTYKYKHVRSMQVNQKVCGIVEHPNPPWIFRSDCKK